MGAVIFFLCLLVAICIAVSSDNRKRSLLERTGETAEGLIVDWRSPTSSSVSNEMAQSISFPIIEFTTKNGEQVKGEPIMGIAESEEPVNVWVTILYNPEKPNEFVLKRKK